ncbi:MAG: GTP pyrophosphokinase [Planctomycetota bacterium]
MSLTEQSIEVATIEKAIVIAANAHAGVQDKQGQPYILHPIRVMMGVQNAAARVVAVLHDVVEDTIVTIDDLRAEGFANEILDALELVTHSPDQTYADYVIACRSNEIARQVKLSDLRDNANLQRLLIRPDCYERDASRLQRYVLSYRFLNDEISEADYRELMMQLEAS